MIIWSKELFTGCASCKMSSVSEDVDGRAHRRVDLLGESSAEFWERGRLCGY